MGDVSTYNHDPFFLSDPAPVEPKIGNELFPAFGSAFTPDFIWRLSLMHILHVGEDRLFGRAKNQIPRTELQQFFPRIADHLTTRWVNVHNSATEIGDKDGVRGTRKDSFQQFETPNRQTFGW